MEKVTGFSCLFFRAHDPVGLTAWYRDPLGITPVPPDYEQLGWRQEVGPTGWFLFRKPRATLGTRRIWMVNFRVRDLDAMVDHGAQVSRGL